MSRKWNRKQVFRKTAAAVLAVAFLFSMASCKKAKKSKRHSGKLIEENMPWYEAQTFVIDNGVDPDRKTQSIHSQLAGSDDENLIFITQGNYELPEDYDWDYETFAQLLISNVIVVDQKTGETKKVIDLLHHFGEGVSPDGVIYLNGNIVVDTSSYDQAANKQIFKEYVIDPLTGDILSVTDTNPDKQASQVYHIGDYQIQVSINWDTATPEGFLYVTDPSGNEKKVKIEGSTSTLYSVESIVPKGKNKAVLFLGANLGYDYLELDLPSGALTRLNAEYFEWLDSYSISKMTNGTDGKIYSGTPTGIYRIDLENKTKEEIFNYSWCSVDRNSFKDRSLGPISENSFILYGEKYEMTPFANFSSWSPSAFEVIVFTKAEKNPHAGKRILELYSSCDYLDEAMCDALTRFNETNGKYFIEVTDRYNGRYVNLNSVSSDDELSKLDNESRAVISNKLSMDILSGDGPDMFLDISRIDQLKNSKHLIDLAPYLGDLDPDKYFTNIVENAKVNGKLFNLPLTFGISGIFTDSAYAGASGVGFTTDEYVDFLRGPLEGKDVILYGQPYYFVNLFNAMRNEFITNGKADFSGPGFAAIAEFVKENVPEQSMSWDEVASSALPSYGAGMFEFTVPAKYTTSYNFADYLITLQQLDSGHAILGLPTADGRGPAAVVGSSIAISKGAYDIDACVDFVKLLMSDEIQEEYALTGSFALARKNFRSTGEAAVEYYNQTKISDLFGGYFEAGPPNRVTYTSEHIDTLENAILHCSSTLTEDADINNLLIEEMPAYFLGQKSLDDVVRILQNRVQNLLDERG
ncbi:MAG: extracellular solute-binding protein [Clostridiales bacterium]|nr:extracellular solute-binding protein [Clostridiales bacterium]